MAYASITYTSASGTTFALTNSSGDPIEYLRQSDIAVTVNGTLKTQGTDYTFNSAGTAIVLATAVSGATVVISRTTSITDATVSFTAGSTLTAQDLNNSDKQNRFALQEFSDTYGAITTGTGDLSVLGGFIGSAETWLSDNAHTATTGAIDGRVDSKIDTALTGDVVAGNAITITDNSPASGQITIAVTDGAIEAAELASNAVTTAKIADGNVTAAKLASDSVTTAKILDANVTTAKIANDAITSAKIADGTIIAGDIAADAITTAKILDANVTTAKIADANITTAKLADSSVTSAKIADGTIVAGDLASDSVTTAKIADSNVTTGKINDSAVTTAKIADSAVTAIKIADGVITSAKLNASTVVTAAEQSGSTPDDTSFFTTSASDGRYVNVTGDTMTGALAMSSNKITGLGTPTVSTDAATKAYVDASVAAGVGDADYGDITVSGTGTVWTIDNGVVTSAKIADGTIVDGDVNASAAIAGTKISPDFGSQTIQTTGVVSHALGTAAAPTLTFTGDTNTGIYSPGADQVAISTNGTGRLFIDSSGRLLVGTSTGYLTSTSTVTQPLFQVHNTNANEAQVSINSWATGTNTGGNLTFCRSDSGAVGTHTVIGVADALGNIRFAGSDGTKFIEGASITASADGTWGADDGPSKLVFSTTADAASSPTERLRIDSSGRVGIGATPSAKLHVNTGTNENLWVGSLGGSGAGVYLASVNDSGSANTPMQIGSASVINFAINGTEAARIDSSRRLLVGTSTTFDQSAPLQVNSSTGYSANLYVFGADNSQVNIGSARGSVGSPSTLNSSDTIGGIYFRGHDGTSFKTGAQIQAQIDGITPSSDLPSRLVFSTTADGASSPTERMRIASNGEVLIGTTGTVLGFGGQKFSIVGPSGFQNSANFVAGFHRTTDDGSIIGFYQADVLEGTISVSGTTVSYNGAHLSRWSQIPGIDPHDKTDRPEILRGTVMSNLDEMCDWIGPESGDAQDNEQLNKTKISDIEGDKNVAGIFQSWDDDDDTWVNDYYLAMTGDFIIRIAEGVTVERGDLLMSAGDGTAKPQDDDIIRSKTIAKVTSANVSCAYEDGSYCVPCVLMAC